MPTLIFEPESGSLPNLSALLQEAKAGLIIAAQHEQSGLSASSHAEVRARILTTVYSESGQAQVRVDSTGLSLDQKLFVEQNLLRHLDASSWPNVSVYFQKAMHTSQDASPKPIKRKSPFGLNIEKRAIAGVSSIVVVASGKGGVGKSTVSTNLAISLVKLGLKVGLMDCDVYGPSAPTMFGLDGKMSVRNGRLVPLEAHGVKVVSFGFLTDTVTPVIWRGPLVAKAIEQLCYDVDWGTLDVLVLDLPPGTGDVQLTLAEKIPITGAVIVTTPQDVALIDAHKAVSMFEKLDVPRFGVVENMAYYTCSQCSHQEHIFGQAAFEKFMFERKLQLLARVPLEKKIRELSDSGSPIALTDHAVATPYFAIANYIFDSVFTTKTKIQPTESRE